MTEQHPKITPPPELVQELYVMPQMRAIEAAFRAGADQELEACCECLRQDIGKWASRKLRAARRPKPPSLKEQALEQLRCIQTDLNKFGMGIRTDTIRRALEQLSD